jgi:methionyl-tRNA formyltransferase
VFFGSSAFAVPSLKALAAQHDLLCVYSQPDRPAGRGLKLRSTPVKETALQLQLSVATPERLNADFVAEVKELRPDLLACAAYGKILPAALLGVPALGALNVHPSLLPAYRGATPIQAALRDGATVSGVTIVWMSSALDAGDIALQCSLPIGPHDNYGTLHDKLAEAGAELLREAAERLAGGVLPRAAQDASAATYTRALSKDELRLDFGRSALELVNLVRSASPSPGAWTSLDGQRLKVLEAKVEQVAGATPPGRLVRIDAAGPVIAAADGGLLLLRVVPEGKPPMSGAQFARALRARPDAQP